MPKYDETTTTKDDLKLITLEQFDEILSITPEDNSFYMPLNLGFYTGMQVSEITALTWDCVDLKNQLIRVEKILYNKNGEWLFGTPKTKSSFRSIHIGATLITILKEHKKRQDENRIKYGQHSRFPKKNGLNSNIKVPNSN